MKITRTPGKKPQGKKKQKTKSHPLTTYRLSIHPFPFFFFFSPLLFFPPRFLFLFFLLIFVYGAHYTIMMAMFCSKEKVSHKISL